MILHGAEYSTNFLGVKSNAPPGLELLWVFERLRALGDCELKTG